MEDGFKTQHIQIKALETLEELYNRDLKDLIDLYLHAARLKIANLHKTLSQKNYENLASEAQELRFRSTEIGAIQFSHLCLSLEITVQEMRIDHLQSGIERLEQNFQLIEKELRQLQALETTIS